MSTREISLLVWGALFVAWAMTVPGVRKSIPGLIRVASHWKLVAPFMVLVAYLGFVVWGLWAVRFWTPALAKDTTVWFLFSGVALAFSGVGLQGYPPTLRGVLGDQVKAIVLVEYILDTYTFALWIELLLIPLIAALVMMDTVARMEQQYEKVAALTRGVLTVFGFAVLVFAVRRAVASVDTFSASAASREVLLPIALSCALLPIVYLFFLVSAYEQLFLALRLMPGKDPSVVGYAKRRLLWRLGLRPTVVRAFSRKHRIALMSVNTKADIDGLLKRRAEQAEHATAG